MSQARYFERNRPKRYDATTSRYGVLVGTVRDGSLDAGRSPHYEIWIQGAGQDFRAAINVQSVDGSEVLVHDDPAYTTTSPALDLAALAAGAQGFTALQTGPDGTGLDYLRDALFAVSSMVPIADTGRSVSLGNLLDAQVERARADAGAVAIVFGTYFRDGGSTSRDSTFGFSPEQGIHDIHMMQGNSGSFENDNTTHGDGALFIRYTGGETVALFVRFGSQATATDSSGNPA